MVMLCTLFTLQVLLSDQPLCQLLWPHCGLNIMSGVFFLNVRGSKFSYLGSVIVQMVNLISDADSSSHLCCGPYTRGEIYTVTLFHHPSLTYFLLHKLTWLNFLPLVSLLIPHFERNAENSAVSGTERKRRYRMLLTIKVASWWKLRPIFILVLLFYGLFF